MRPTVRRARFVLGLVTAAIAAGAGCNHIVGIQPLVTGDTSGTGGQGGAGAAGSTSTHGTGGSGTSVSTGSGGASVSTAGSGGASVSTSSTSASSGTGIVSCNDALMSGTFAGDPFQQKSSANTVGGIPGDPWQWIQSYAGPGFMHLIGSENADPSAFTPDQPYAIVFGMLRLNADATAHAGEWACITPGSTVTNQTSGPKVLSLAVHALGACPGQPVNGTLDFCPGCMPQWTGTLDGVAPPPTGSVMGADGTDPAGDGIDTQAPGFWTRHSLTTTIQANPSGAIAEGIIYTDPSGPFAGAVFCVGSGSTYNWPTSLHLQNLTKLGQCPTAKGADTISACF
jgi:hypothetical protein